MAAGKQNWEKYWKGKDGLITKVKKANPYYENYTTSKSSGSLIINQEIVYDNSSSQHIALGGNTKIGFKFKTDTSGEIYYSPVDNFRKPGITNLQLSPSSFGISNVTFQNSLLYYNAVIKAIIDRWGTGDYSGELYDYLIELVEFAYKNTRDFGGIVFEGFNWGEIRSSFAELIGPLVCIHHQSVLSGLGINLSSAQIYIPPNSEPLYDYKLITNNAEYLISAKSGQGVANQVKPRFIVNAVDGILPTNLKSSVAYQLIKILNEYSIVMGPFRGWQLIQPKNSIQLTPEAIADIIQNYSDASKSVNKLKNPDLFLPFIEVHFPNQSSEIQRKNITYGQVRYKCETLIQTASKTGQLNQDLKKIFNYYLNYSRVIYVKMAIQEANGIPSFSSIISSGTDVKTVSQAELRSSNDQNRHKDKMGYDNIR